ncbi:hypothetical protein [Leisingera sp. MMG026]|uniref:hypothetical protein n=1 Tax=Leisingera sp. MMG026 TaxID=2909982 RepID=UPI001F330C7F|nr:hypothetical protein [Leisingera sp. MMG026]
MGKTEDFLRAIHDAADPGDRIEIPVASWGPPKPPGGNRRARREKYAAHRRNKGRV